MSQRQARTLSREKLSDAVRGYALAFQQLNNKLVPAIGAEIDRIYSMLKILDKRLKALEPKEANEEVVPVPEQKTGSEVFDEAMQKIVDETEPEQKGVSDGK